MASVSLASTAPNTEIVPALDVSHAIRVGALVALLALGAYLRLANLSDNPGWDADEGYNWSIASNLANGHLQLFGLRYAFVQHPPFFYLLGALLMRLWTPDLLALRTLSALCGVLTIPCLLGLCTQLAGRRLGYAAAAIYTLWPQAVLQVRWAYTYNLVALLMVAALWAALWAAPMERKDEKAGSSSPTGPDDVLRYRSMLPAMLAGVLSGLALSTDQEALPLLLAIAMLLWPRGGRQVAVGMMAAVIPPALYLGWMLATRPAFLLFDIQHTASRLGDGCFLAIVARLIHMSLFDPLIAVGLLGVFLLPAGRRRSAILVLMVLLLIIILKVRDPAPLFRAAEPLLPLCAVGLGLVALAVLDLLRQLVSGPDSAGARLRACVASAVLLVPLAGAMLANDVQGVTGHFTTGLAAVLPRSTLDARRMAAWVNARVQPNDLVISMPGTAWLLHCRTTELLQAVAISGYGVDFYPDGLPPERFAYDTHLTASRYLVVDDFTRLWIRDPQSQRGRLLVNLARASWPIAYSAGEYTIYANPSYRGNRRGNGA